MLNRYFIIALLFLQLISWEVFSQLRCEWPYSGYVANDTLIEFFWSGTSISSEFTFQISTDNQFGSYFVDSVLQNQNACLVDLDNNQNYYWRVIDNNDDTSQINLLTTFSLIDQDDIYFQFVADSGVAAISSYVYDWQNTIDTSIHIRQSVASQRPLFKTNIKQLNNNPSVRFDGVNDYIKTNTFDLPQPYNYFLVFKTYSKTGDVIDGGDFTRGLLRLETNKYKYKTGTSWSISQTQIDTSKYVIINLQVDNDTTDIFINDIFDSRDRSGVNSTLGLTIGAIGHGGGNYSNVSVPEIVAYNNTLSDSIRDITYKYLKDKYAPKVHLGIDVFNKSFCDTSIYAGDNYTSYIWSSGSFGDTIVVRKTNWYRVTVTDVFGFNSIDSIYIEYPVVPKYPISSELICQGETRIWNTNLNNSDFSFLWNTGQTDSVITIDTAGQYWVTVTDNFGCYRISDTLTVVVDSFPIAASLGDDITMCSGNFIGLKDGEQETQSYLWSTSAITNTIQINSSGIYHVSLTNTNGCFARDTIDITIQGDAPNAQFFVDNECVYDSTSFIDQSTPNDLSNIVQWQWDLGNGVTSNLQHPVVKFEIDSIFTASLTVTTDSGCSQYTSGTFEVYPIPKSQLNVLNTIFCTDNKVGFRADSISHSESWILDFGDVSQPILTAENLDTIHHVYNSAGDYLITLITQSNQGCVDTMYSLVSIDESPAANFDYQKDCEGEPVQFVDQTEGANNGWIWKWKFGDGQTQTGQTPNPINTYAQAGIYNVTMSLVDHNGCRDTIEKQVEVSENPIADFYVKDFCLFTPIQVFDSTYSVDNIVTWNWNVVNHPNQSNLQNPYFNFTYLNPSTYNLKLSVVTEVGCVDEVTKVITIHEQPIADFTFSPEFGGAPLEVDFTNASTSGETYLWNFGTGDSSSDENPLYTYQENDIYDIQLITYNEFGCADTAFDFIKITPPILDMAVSKVYTNTIYDDAYLQVIADLVNLGTREVNTFDLIATTSNGSTVLEQWVGQLYTLDGETYLFNAAFELTDGQLPSSVCVKLVDPNGESDDVPSNNEYCISLDEFIVFEPYPNPANDELNLEFILPDKGQIDIVIYNALGQHVRTLNSYDGVKGVNRISIRVDGLSADVYSLVIQYQDQSALKKFIRIDQE